MNEVPSIKAQNGVLTKSYINTYNAANPIIDSLVMNDVMDPRRSQSNGELVVLETKERRFTAEIFERVRHSTRSLS